MAKFFYPIFEGAPESDVVINEYRSDEQKKYIYMEPRPNAIIYAFYSHDGFNVVEPFVSQSSETKTRPKNALRRKLVFLSYRWVFVKCRWLYIQIDFLTNREMT